VRCGVGTEVYDDDARNDEGDSDQRGRVQALLQQHGADENVSRPSRPRPRSRRRCRQRQCYRHASMILRARLDRLQGSVEKTIKAIKRKRAKRSTTRRS
jgi:hypothetical protein